VGFHEELERGAVLLVQIPELARLRHRFRRASEGDEIAYEPLADRALLSRAQAGAHGQVAADLERTRRIAAFAEEIGQVDVGVDVVAVLAHGLREGAKRFGAIPREERIQRMLVRRLGRRRRRTRVARQDPRGVADAGQEAADDQDGDELAHSRAAPAVSFSVRSSTSPTSTRRC